MGYNTSYTGDIRFKKPLTQEQIDHLSIFLGGDTRDHPGWRPFLPKDTSYIHIDLEWVGNGTGLVWDGCEKSNYMVESLNFLSSVMRSRWPDFQFEGTMLAQGEEVGDLWQVKFTEDGQAYRSPINVQDLDKDPFLDIEDYANWVERGWNGKGSYPTEIDLRPKPIEERDLTIMSLGLAGETGEVIELLKKRVRDGKFDLEDFKLEMGDVLFYWCRLARAFNVTPTEIIRVNVEKLNKRRTEKAEKAEKND